MAGEAEMAGAGARAGDVTTGCCGLWAVTLEKKPATACRALERERDMFSKTREGSRGGLLGSACLTARGRAAAGIAERRNR